MYPPSLLKASPKGEGVHPSQSGTLSILQAPTGGIVAMEGYGYILPLLVSNRSSSMQTLSLTTPWRSFEFLVPAQSIRGFCLNLPRFFGIGEHQASVLVSAGKVTEVADFKVDVRPTGTLVVHLQDDTDEPAAARFYLSGADRLSHMPGGGLQRIARETGEYFFYAEDRFQIVLPAGEATIEAVRGLEYAPVQKTILVRANDTLQLQLQLDHRFRLSQQNWYSGDAHIHANYLNNELVGVEDIHLQVSAEGLDVANLMVANSGGAIIHDERFFEGKPHALSRGSRILYWNEEMRNRRLYGHMSFFNLKKLVYPLYTGFPGTPHWEDYPPNFNQAEKARAQNGAVAYVHPAIGTTLMGVGFGGAREFPVDLALGQVDALDVLSNTLEMPATELWYRVLNTGLRCALSAGSDSFTNLMMHWVPGGGRVYVRVPAEFSYQGWIDNYRAGRSFCHQRSHCHPRRQWEGAGRGAAVSGAEGAGHGQGRGLFDCPRRAAGDCGQRLGSGVSSCARRDLGTDRTGGGAGEEFLGGRPRPGGLAIA